MVVPTHIEVRPTRRGEDHDAHRGDAINWQYTSRMDQADGTAA